MNDTKTKCLVCNPGADISVSRRGNHSLNLHVSSEKHSRAMRGAAFLTKVASYFATLESKREDTVTAAEGIYAFHTVKHITSFHSCVV